MRLTRRMCGGYGMVEGHELSTVQGMRDAINKLAYYEDMEEQGKLVIVEEGSVIWKFLNCCCFDGGERDGTTE